jgi:hypothetical protein
MSFAERLFGAVSKHLPNGVNQGITASYFKGSFVKEKCYFLQVLIACVHCEPWLTHSHVAASQSSPH